MNKKGFIATSLIYSFFLVFCAMIASYVAINIHNKMLLNRVITQIKEDLNTQKYLKDIEVGNHVKVNVKYNLSDLNVDISDLDYLVTDINDNTVTLVSNGIAFTLNPETNNNFGLTQEAINYQLTNFSNSCASNFRTLTIDDLDLFFNIEDKETMKNLINVNLYYLIIDRDGIDYFAYNDDIESAYQNGTIDDMRTEIVNNLFVNIDNDEQIGVRLVLELQPNIMIKGGEGTDLSPYVLEGRCN